MAKKTKEPDKLALDMIQCRQDGYGCHYGAWKALQDRPVVIKKKEDEIPDGWKVCLYCRKPFKPKKYSNNRQIYCEIECQKSAQRERDREKFREYRREYMAKKRAEERKVKNECNA